MQIRLDVRFCPLAATGATSTHDGLWRAISDPSSTGSGMRLSKWSNGKGGFDEQYQLAGDAVMIAPVSRRFPCKQGIFQEIPQIWPPGDTRRRLNPLHRSGFRASSLLYRTANY